MTSWIGKEISAGKSIEFTIYFEMDSQYKVENEIMVLEVDFFVSWNSSSKRMGEDVILLSRPENLPKADAQSMDCHSRNNLYQIKIRDYYSTSKTMLVARLPRNKFHGNATLRW